MLHFCACSADSWRRVLKSNALIAPSNFSSELLPAVVPASASPSRVSLVMAAVACSEAHVGWMIV